MKKSLFFGLLFVMILLAGCGGGQSGYQTISLEEANDLRSQEGVVVIDVRTPEEYEQGHVPNAQLHPLQEIDKWANELDKTQKYIVICRSGNRSAQASAILADNGFEQIYNVSDGMRNWQWETEKGAD